MMVLLYVGGWLVSLLALYLVIRLGVLHGLQSLRRADAEAADRAARDAARSGQG